MLLNEDFFDEQDIDVSVSSIDSNIESENYMMQDKRPVEQLLAEFQCFGHISLNLSQQQISSDYVYKLCDRLKKFLDAIQNTEISKIIIGSSLTAHEYNKDETIPEDQITWLNYLVRQTRDDNGITENTHLFFGVKTLRKDNYILAQSTLTKILNIIGNLTDITEIEMIFRNIDFNSMFLNTNDKSYLPKDLLKNAISTME